MVRLREIPRTAAFAWSPGAELPLIVTGTRAGAVDADFSDETKLELWDLSLDNLGQGLELRPLTSVTTDSRFHDIVWAPANADHPRGIIAGALENGSLDLWDAERLINGKEDAFMSRTTKHTGAIKSLQFNPLKPQILATAGAKGELYIYDVNDIANPFRLGTAQARADDLECVAWNRKVPHILATGGVGGFVTIWDLKTKKASLSLSNHKRPVGAIAWDPNNATKLLTATPDDSNPVILLWDLRNSNAPERTLQGHEQGILSLSWCQQDSNLLLSSGKDNRTLCWNPQTGELLGEFPEVTNWTFQTQFHPHNPNLSATASFDGKISVQTLQNTNTSTTQTVSTQGASDAEDFFTKAQTQPQGASFTLQRAPKWLECPVGASFGFGGKLVVFRLQPASAGHTRHSKIELSQFAVDSEVGTATESFESSLKAGDMTGICEIHIGHAKTEAEKVDWKVIETLVAENPRKRVIEYLGLAELGRGTSNDEAIHDEEGKEESHKLEENGAFIKKNNRLSTFFADGGDSDDFLSDLTATKGAKTNSPFKLLPEKDSISDQLITKALMLGQFEMAMDICLKEDRMADAFMIANCGGKNLLEKAQTAYLSKKADRPNYLRLLTAVIGKNLWDIIYNADLSDWKESMATLCTYAEPTEFSDLCEALGDRILESGSRKDACFCYLVGSKLEKVVGIWISELPEYEEADIQKSSGDSAFSIHARSLQNFIEKVTVFRNVAKFQDHEQKESAGWKLSSLYDKYIEYADIVAAHGYLDVAEKYLNLLPVHYPAAEIARNRVKMASRKLDQQVNGPHNISSNNRTATNSQAAGGFQAQQLSNTLHTSTVMNPYAPTTHSNSYNPSNVNSYAPQPGYLPPQQPGYLPPQQQQNYGNATMTTPVGYQPSGTSNSFGAPPKSVHPSVPPPSRASNISNWNDTPMVTKPIVSRRGTPGNVQASITSPFPNQQVASLPPAGPPLGGTRGTSTPPPPPPKGSALPRVTSPLSNGGPPSFQQPAVASPNTSNYTPPPPQTSQSYGKSGPLPSIARGASPYNPPPAGPPPTNRYTPAPSTQISPANSQFPSAPPGNSRPPLSNPYAPQFPNATQQIQQIPVTQLQQNERFQQEGQVSQAPPPSSTPSTAQSQPPKPPASVIPKHPPGDRSHIPPRAQRMVAILDNEMKRVAGKAPPSFAAQVENTQKRLSTLFDHLNNETLVKVDTIERLNELAQALQARNYDIATRIQVDVQRDNLRECGNWMVGVKRLISMSKVTP